MGSLNPSGMERMFISAAEVPVWISPDSESQTVIVCQGTSHPFRLELESAGYTVVAISPIDSFSGILQMSKVLKDFTPDIVHIHTEGAFAVAVWLVVTRSRKSKIIRTVHNIFPTRGRTSFSRRVQAALADFCVDSFIAPSPDVAENERALGRNCRVIFNWVGSKFSTSHALGVSNLTAAKELDASVPSVVMVGNCSRIKNHQFVLDILVSSSLGLYLHGSEADASEREVRLLDRIAAEGRLLHRGTGDPFYSLLKGSVYLMPSLREGFAVALAEALSMGLPCVVSDVPGLRWARDLPGVFMLPLDDARWRELLTVDWCRSVGNFWDRRTLVDFSAERGVRDYQNVYRNAICS